jgi:hypothetical protein
VNAEQSRVLEAHDGGIHEDEDDIDNHQLDQRGAELLLRTELEVLNGACGIKHWEDDFLDREPDKLDLLEDFKRLRKARRVVGVGAEFENPADGVEDKRIDDDHCQHAAQDLAGVDKEM